SRRIWFYASGQKTSSIGSSPQSAWCGLGWGTFDKPKAMKACRALLALDPIRLRNFATLEIGSNFVSLDGKWWIVLDDTKSGRPDHRPVPVLLTPLIARYLELHRVILCGDETPRRRRQVQASTAPRPDRTKALWISRFAGPLSYSEVERVITETTRVLTGRPISPHLFRAAAATSAALSLSPHLASALLQHADSRVTESTTIAQDRSR